MQFIDPIEFRIAMPIPVGEILINPLYDHLLRPAAVFFTDPTDATSLSLHSSIKASQIVYDQAHNEDGLRYLLGVELEEFRRYLVRIAFTHDFEKALALKAQAIVLLRPKYMTGHSD